MELVVRDVSALLKVSEKTVYRWIAQHKLPAHRINEQYRFNRTELLEWATANRIPISADILKEDYPAELPGLAEALQTGGIFYRVDGADKTAVLSEVVRIMPLPQAVDRAFLLEVLLARESLGSTGIGDGVALPHVRNPIVLHVQHPMISLCFLEHPVPFDAIDGRPVDTLFTIVSPTIRGHLHLLARLSFALQQTEFKSVVARKDLREELFRAAESIDQRLEEAVSNPGGASL
jgi:PTS system nitrogen regulatory IIA component